MKRNEPVRRHHNNTAKERIKRGLHEKPLKRIAKKLKVPYGKKGG